MFDSVQLKSTGTSGELRGRGLPIRLREQSMRVLLALLDGGGRVVTREELRRRLWPDGAFVEFDWAINKAVCELRRALHRPGERSMVETVSKRGYRIAADLNEASCPCSGFVRAEAGLATDAAAAYMTGRQAEGDGHIGTVTWVPPTSRLPARARIATRWLAHVAAECGAERTRRPVADAFRYFRKPEAFPAQQVLRDRHPPCEQVFHRWQADGTCEAFEERRTRQGGAQSTTSVAPVIAG